jgi:recombination protein RecA
MAFGKDKDKKKEKARPTMSLMDQADPKADDKVKAALRAAFADDPEVVRTDPGASSVYKYNTGILSLDRALGVGGLLGGRIVDTSGDNGTGKTLVNMGIGAAIQQQGGTVGYCDAEGTFSAPFARATGLNVNEGFYYVRSTPQHIMTGEDYFLAIQKMVQLGVNYIIVDSCPALVPSDKFTKQFGEGQQATHARMMSEELGKLAAFLTASPRSIVAFINQIRGVPNVMFGPTEKSTGGNALTFFRSYNFEMRRARDIVGDVVKGDGSSEKKIIGVEVTVTLTKNKTAAKPVEPIGFNMFTTFGTLRDGTVIEPGVDKVRDVFEVGKATGAIEQKSSWFQFEDLKGNGEVDFISGLRTRPELVQKIRDIVLSEGVVDDNPPDLQKV